MAPPRSGTGAACRRRPCSTPALLALLAALIAGVVPALKVTGALDGRLRMATAGGGGFRFGGVWTAVVVVQVAAMVAFPVVAVLLARRGRRHSRRAERIRRGGVPVGASGDGSRNGVRRSHRCLARGLYRTLCRGVPRARAEAGSRVRGRQRHLLRRAASHEPRDARDRSGWWPCADSGSHRQGSAGQIRGRGSGLLTTHERSGHRGTGLP